MGLHQHMFLPPLGLTGLFFSGVNAMAPLKDLCPVICIEAGPNPSNWTVIAEFTQLQACQRPMVLDFSVRIPVADKQHIRVCNVFINDFDSPASSNITWVSTEDEFETKQVNPKLAWTPAASEDEIGGRLAVQSAGHLQSYLANSRQALKRIQLFGTVSGTTVGVYVGANLLCSSVAGDLFDSFLNNLYSTGIANSKAALVQLCEGRSGDDIFGLIAASSATFSTVHSAVSHWSNGTCVDTSSYAKTRELNAISIGVVKPKLAPTPSNGTALTRGQRRAATCRTLTVDSGDSCAKLVTKCGGGLTAANFYKYNPKSNLCSTLMPGQRVCCTSGALPDIRPKQLADGSCFSYKIKSGDFCNKIATANGLTVQDLVDFNKETWSWNGCEVGFWPDNWICLSKGTPPFPAPISNAVCGPQKPGTTKPSGSTSRDWAKLNPCPLNACCNIWGQCGTTTDFCIDTNTGPPGTAKPGTYGCISNCGISIVRSGPPAQFIKLGYFEGFNLGRDCLNMDATQVDPSFTHIHFAFGMINNQFEIYQQDAYAEFQFQQFKKIKTAKRVISFGGWVFSAEAPNYPIFRNAVSTAANREKLANNLVAYVVNNGLDGLDIDWEYPSAPDLPDIPKGDISEALNYLRLLAAIRSRLPKSKTLSIAAPSSYWYLKQFPIKAMSELLDYIVYMTYDLHGQWDAGNEWASPGCPTGNCLRSHINRTETMNALTMITKAGVPSSKVLVGVSSYGRSFQMADPSCTGPNCLFTGDRKTSYARKGRCTQTNGYLANAEINEIGGRTWTDVGSDSIMMVDGDLWVSYMDNNLKERRTQMYKNYEMGGTIDWAVDLVQFHKPPYGAQDGIFLEDWVLSKKQIKEGGDLDQVVCNKTKEIRTGTWVSKESGMAEAESDYLSYTPGERWEALDCQHAWEDAIRVWRVCYKSADESSSYKFTQAMGQFLYATPSAKCDDLAINTDCDSIGCDAHNDASDPITARTGACAYLIWNSIAALHAMIKNYYYSLKFAGDNVKDKQDSFISTFAPKPETGLEIFNLFLSLIPIPLEAGFARWLGGDMMTRAFAKDGISPSTWEEQTSGLIGVGTAVAQDALKTASETRTEVSFNNIYDKLIKSWESQTDTLIKRVFGGGDESIRVLGNLLSDGKMIIGKRDKGTVPGNHTDQWEQERNIERAFYAAAIPAAWAANSRGPIVVDFGHGCEIDARKYFYESPETYNIGWRCINQHSYILAGVRDGPQKLCGPNNSGDNGVCKPTLQWTFDILDGIGDIRDNNTEKWGGVTISDLIIGALNTYNTNGQKNIMDPTIKTPGASDLTEAYKGNSMDIRRAGLIRIPVCGAEEATTNLIMGREVYGNSTNYPCNP